LGKSIDRYVITFGTRDLFCVARDVLRKYSISNGRFDAAGHFRLYSGSLADLSGIFAKDTFDFIGLLLSNSSGSQGLRRKFTGRDIRTGDIGIVKFDLPERMLYECLYDTIGSRLGIRVCRASLGIYAGKPCVISCFEYNPYMDVVMSFKQRMKAVNRDLDALLQKLSIDDRHKFDKYMILDYILEQADRHMSNLALCNDGLYPLYDNGCCLGSDPIGYFSQQFRLYAERLQANYVNGLFSSISVASEVKDILNEYKIDTVLQERVLQHIERIGLC
jgi:hypothetical protein